VCPFYDLQANERSEVDKKCPPPMCTSGNTNKAALAIQYSARQWLLTVAFWKIITALNHIKAGRFLGGDYAKAIVLSLFWANLDNKYVLHTKRYENIAMDLSIFQKKL
jgi:hypothetical protein